MSLDTLMIILEDILIVLQIINSVQTFKNSKNIRQMQNSNNRQEKQLDKILNKDCPMFKGK
ncbi:MAG: hypothetical protein IGS23_14085 [Rivularia sp. T60_A2020_040]|nr:hypothetical protein [Rivularia sp. T60_A2020_040]